MNNKFHKLRSNISKKVSSGIMKINNKFSPKISKAKDKLRKFKLSIKSKKIKIGKDEFKDYRELEQPCMDMIDIILEEEIDYVKKCNTIAKNFNNLLKENSDLELEIEKNGILLEFKENYDKCIRIYKDVLDTKKELKSLWNNDKNNKKEQLKNKRVFSLIVKNPSILKKGIDKKYVCATSRSMYELDTFPARYNNISLNRMKFVNNMIVAKNSFVNLIQKNKLSRST